MRDDAASSATTRSRYRANELLRKVVSLGVCDLAALARHLVSTSVAVESYLRDESPVPLDRQLRLAQLVIAHVPALRREGHRLRGQVAAAAEFTSGSTAR